MRPAFLVGCSLSVPVQVWWEDGDARKQLRLRCPPKMGRSVRARSAQTVGCRAAAGCPILSAEPCTGILARGRSESPHSCSIEMQGALGLPVALLRGMPSCVPAHAERGTSAWEEERRLPRGRLCGPWFTRAGEALVLEVGRRLAGGSGPSLGVPAARKGGALPGTQSRHVDPAAQTVREKSPGGDSGAGGERAP